MPMPISSKTTLRCRESVLNLFCSFTEQQLKELEFILCLTQKTHRVTQSLLYNIKCFMFKVKMDKITKKSNIRWTRKVLKNGTI